MVTPINNNKMYKYDYIKVYNLNELILGLDYFSEYNYKLITAVNFHNALYLIFKK